jgi:hypothetical protein
LIGADAVIASSAPADRDWIVLLNCFVLAIASGAVTLQVGACWWLLCGGSGRWKRAGLGAILLCQVVVAGWAGWRFHVASRPAAATMEGGLAMDPVAGQALFTDKQRLVPVFRARLDGDMRAYFELDAGQPSGPSIQRAGDDARSNCHGWVFAGGQYLITGSGVQMILDDNGYRQVIQPQPGDVIVYRDSGNQIVHTGLVQTAFDDGQVLVESKWGVSGVFLHLPEDQPYTRAFGYYRRATANRREPHLVQAVTVLPGNLVLSRKPLTILAGQPRTGDPTSSQGDVSPAPESESVPIGAE